MLTPLRLLPGAPLRLSLMLLVLALAGRPALAQDNAKAGDSATTATEAAAPASASGVLIPVDDAATSGARAVNAAPISNPALEESNIAPVVNQLPKPIQPPAAGALDDGADPEEDANTLPTPPPPAAAPAPAAPSAAPAASPVAPADGAAAGEEGEEQNAPYLRDLKPIEIFDAGKAEETTPLQRVAKSFEARKAARERLSLANIQNLSTYEYEIEGPSEEKIFQEAQTRALLSAAGRIYFEDAIILGLDLLEPYLRENGKSFITRTSVLEHRSLSATRVAMRVRVSVNLDALYNDLQKKHFLAKPNLRPVVGVLLQEIVNGERNTATGGRRRIERTMEENMFQVYSEKMRSPALDVDASASSRLLKEARMEAERNTIDVLISGTLIVQPVNATKIYYDNFAFKEAEVTLKMYRVDNGELLAEVRDRYSAAAGQEQDATQRVLDAMVNRATQRLAEELDRRWTNTMHVQENNYRLMITGVNPGDVTGIENGIKALSAKLDIYTKSYLGDVLVLNLSAPGVASEKVEAFLRESTEPQFSVKRVDKRRLILEVR